MFSGVHACRRAFAFFSHTPFASRLYILIYNIPLSRNIQLKRVQRWRHWRHNDDSSGGREKKKCPTITTLAARWQKANKVYNYVSFGVFGVWICVNVCLIPADFFFICIAMAVALSAHYSTCMHSCAVTPLTPTHILLRCLPQSGAPLPSPVLFFSAVANIFAVSQLCVSGICLSPSHCYTIRILRMAHVDECSHYNTLGLPIIQ